MKFEAGDILHQTLTGRNLLVLKANKDSEWDEEYDVYDFFLGKTRNFYWNSATKSEWVLYHNGVVMKPPKKWADLR